MVRLNRYSGAQKRLSQKSKAILFTFVAGIVIQFNSLFPLAHARAFQLSKSLKKIEIGSIVENAAKSYLEAPQAVGLSVGIVKDGRTYAYNFGTLEPQKQERPTERTIYYLASITKTFTATLLAQAAVEGRLKVDDDIRKYLEGDYPNLEFEGHAIRLCDLVNHRSGLPMILPERADLLGGSDKDVVSSLVHLNEVIHNYSRKQFFDDLHQVKLVAVPGTQFKYSNAAGQLLGYILERVYGKSYETLIREKITQPLKMKDTAITLTPAQTLRYARGFNEAGIAMPYSPNEFQGAGSLKSTVSDMLKYLRWELEEADKAVKLTHEPRFTEENYGVGLNWQIHKNGGVRTLWQNGNVPGFSSYCIFSPELGIGIVLLTNEGDGTAPSRIARLGNQALKALDPRYVPFD